MDRFLNWYASKHYTTKLALALLVLLSSFVFTESMRNRMNEKQQEYAKKVCKYEINGTYATLNDINFCIIEVDQNGFKK